MFKVFFNRFLTAAAVIAVIGFCSQNPVFAQVVNSTPGTSSATSQVTLTASVPSIILVQVNSGSSTLSASVSPALIGSASNVTSQDFRIVGNVIANSASAAPHCTLSATTLTLVNGSDSITVNLTGTIGGTNISTNSFTPTMTSKSAAINITGDLDESTVTTAKAPGNYTGTLTITASLI